MQEWQIVTPLYATQQQRRGIVMDVEESRWRISGFSGLLTGLWDNEAFTIRAITITLHEVKAARGGRAYPGMVERE